MGTPRLIALGRQLLVVGDREHQVPGQVGRHVRLLHAAGQPLPVQQRPDLAGGVIAGVELGQHELRVAHADHVRQDGHDHPVGRVQEGEGSLVERQAQVDQNPREHALERRRDLLDLGQRGGIGERIGRRREEDANA